MVSFSFFRYCGTTFPGNFSSTTNELVIKFHSDDTVFSSGFLIYYEPIIWYCRHTLCKEGEGDCSSDSECEGSLVCGHNNCVNSTLRHCCTQKCNNDSDCTSGECNTERNQCHLNSDTIDWSKCSQDSPCADGEGDCDHHSDCEGTLLCGNDRCLHGPASMDCCIGKFLNNRTYRTFG